MIDTTLDQLNMNLSIDKYRKIKAFLVGIIDKNISALEAASLAEELKNLANTLELEILSLETVNIRENHVKYGMGTGKAEELAQKAALLEADCIIFDRVISPSQQRNWEALSGIAVLDRQELIIQIFASRASTREAALQVQMAELTYSLPRLEHKYIDLSRQRGGRYGTRGSGETRLETDRRRLEQRIHKLKEELEEVKSQRQVQRKLRKRQGVPVCALVGYTNSGKSTILNALTGAGVLAEDKLFATLDSTSRKLKLPLGTEVLLIDTVGFIRRLPHSLINAFRSTMEEASHADILLFILDASSPDINEHYETTLSVLGDLGARDIPIITVLNKIDKLESAEALLRQFSGSVPVSAIDGKGLDLLCGRIESTLSRANMFFRFPVKNPELAAMVHRKGLVVSEKYGEDFIEMEAKVDERVAGILKKYKVKECFINE